VNRPLPEKTDIIVVGAGLMGTSIAYHLARLGAHRVLILEQGFVGAQGATAKSLGGIRTQFATEINVRFSLASKTVFENFEAEFGVTLHYTPSGYLYLTGSNRGRRIFESTAALLDRMGLFAEILDPEEIARRWPFLETGDLAGACWTPQDGYYSINEVVQGFAQGARRLGVHIHEETKVTEVLTRNRRVTGVRTHTGRIIQSDWVVNAAGPWSGLVAASAGVDLPVGPLRRHLFMTGPFDRLPPLLPFILYFDSGWYMRREGPALLLAGPSDNTDSQRTFSEKVDFDAQEWTAEQSIQRIPVLENAGILRGWIGHYALSPDRHAVIGAYPELSGFVVCTGFSGHGFQHSPAAGRVTAELIVLGRSETLDIHPLRPTRFREKDLIEEPLTSFKNP